MIYTNFPNHEFMIYHLQTCKWTMHYWSLETAHQDGSSQDQQGIVMINIHTKARNQQSWVPHNNKYIILTNKREFGKVRGNLGKKVFLFSWGRTKWKYVPFCSLSKKIENVLCRTRPTIILVGRLSGGSNFFSGSLHFFQVVPIFFR